ncbi:MAG: sugar phosphate isomerase/epimerase [Clostridia bacterium]|nr:sugar phosphate isomerase/epimerase [Clostridia bacterium]
MDYGIQLYSVRDLASQDLEAALKAVAEIGYKYVEFAGFFGNDAETVKGWLDKYGLVCSSTHSSWTELRDDFEGTVKYHKIIGNKNYIIPGADLSTPEKLQEFVDFCNEYAPKLAAEGISLQYHNHAHEFHLHEDGQMIYSVLECKTDIDLETDTYWLYVGKTNPLAVLDRLKDRINMIHSKDGDIDGHGKPLGLGTAPVADVYAKAKEYGMLMVVESETCTPSGIEEAKICFDYLKSLE